MQNWVEVEAGALQANLSEFRRLVGPEVLLGAVVKSNAYGHGLLEVAQVVGEASDWLCVNSVDEGRRLRRAGYTKPILVLGHVALDTLETVVEHDLRAVVYDSETLDRLEPLASAAGRPARLHLKLETGTQRQGVDEAEALRLARRIEQSPSLLLDGIYTHFANVEDTTDHAFAERQIRRFEELRGALDRAGHRPQVCHAACSAATLLFRRTHHDLVRIGISLYGLWPSRETYVSCVERGRQAPELRPALTWKTRVAQVKQVAEGSFIGYGCSYRATRDSRIAVLPVGYFEGYDRGLSGVGHVLVRGRRAPLRGRVCMNMCMVDVTDCPDVGLGDEVVLLGSQGDERIEAEQLATWCGTIPYEIVSRIHSDLPRVVI